MSITYDETRETPHHIIRLVSTADDLTADDRQRLDAALADAVHWSEDHRIDRESMIDYDARHLPWAVAAEMTVTRTGAGRRAAATCLVESFLEDWDRHEWMSSHGEWASESDSQVRPDEGDYIATGIIDPDGVADDAEWIDGAGYSWLGWDCREGWSAHTHQGALYMRWFRDACGDRHDRDLWVHVCDGFDEI